MQTLNIIGLDRKNLITRTLDALSKANGSPITKQSKARQFLTDFIGAPNEHTLDQFITDKAPQASAVKTDEVFIVSVIEKDNGSIESLDTFVLGDRKALNEKLIDLFIGHAPDNDGAASDIIFALKEIVEHNFDPDDIEETLNFLDEYTDPEKLHELFDWIENRFKDSTDLLISQPILDHLHFGTLEINWEIKTVEYSNNNDHDSTNQTMGTMGWAELPIVEYGGENKDREEYLEELGHFYLDEGQVKKPELSYCLGKKTYMDMFFSGDKANLYRVFKVGDQWHLSQDNFIEIPELESLSEYEKKVISGEMGIAIGRIVIENKSFSTTMSYFFETLTERHEYDKNFKRIANFNLLKTLSELIEKFVDSYKYFSKV